MSSKQLIAVIFYQLCRLRDYNRIQSTIALDDIHFKKQKDDSNFFLDVSNEIQDLEDKNTDNAKTLRLVARFLALYGFQPQLEDT